MSIDKMGVWLKFWGSPSYAKDSFIAVLKEAIWKTNTIFLNFCRKCVNKVFVLQISGIRGIFSTKYTTFLAYFFKLVEFTFRHVNFKIIFSVQFARREFEDKDPLILPHYALVYRPKFVKSSDKTCDLELIIVYN